MSVLSFACAILAGSIVSTHAADPLPEALTKLIDNSRVETGDVGKVLADPMQLAISDISGKVSSPEGDREDVSVTSSRHDPNYILIDVQRTRFADDSQEGLRRFWISQGLDDGKFKVIAQGIQIRCWRGQNKMVWQTKNCP
ncbi:MAG: hypothetical protein AAF468_04245 [Pseudomonadota bacterium]